MRLKGLVAIASFVAVPLMAQHTTQTPGRPTLWRNPRTAAILGTLVPGLGHVYSTEYLQGLGIWATTGSLIGWGRLAYEVDRCTFGDAPCDAGPQWPHRTLGALLIAGAGTAWIVTAIDAPRAARRANARHGLRMAQVTPVIEPRAGHRGGVNVGVAMRW